MSKKIISFVLLLSVVYIVGYITTGIVYNKVLASIKFEPDTVLYPGDLEVKPVSEDTLQTDQYTPIQPSITPICKELSR